MAKHSHLLKQIDQTKKVRSLGDHKHFLEDNTSDSLINKILLPANNLSNTIRKQFS